MTRHFRFNQRQGYLQTLALFFICLLSGCSTLNGAPRSGESTVGCARKVLADKVPAGLKDKQTHCIAAGMIARYCSKPEAYLAGVGKEVRDAFTTHGDAEWADLRADTAGIRCAKSSADDASLLSCCEQFRESR